MPFDPVFPTPNHAQPTGNLFRARWIGSFVTLELDLGLCQGALCKVEPGAALRHSTLERVVGFTLSPTPPLEPLP